MKIFSPIPIPLLSSSSSSELLLTTHSRDAGCYTWGTEKDRFPPSAPRYPHNSILGNFCWINKYLDQGAGEEGIEDGLINQVESVGWFEVRSIQARACMAKYDSNKQSGGLES
jgi:hypothetical protein